MRDLSPRTIGVLVATGTAGGIFSGLFGVGGGTVIVPMLIWLLAFGEREATGTSLAAITIIAAFAALGHGFYGNVDIAEGIAIGIPAVAGVVAGTAFQQRVPERVVALAFAALLLAVSVELFWT
jgi:hypothetical protein